MNKKEIQVDGTTYVVDGISFEYAQLDGENSGRSDNGSMIRDVIGLTYKVLCDFKDKSKWSGATLSNLLQLVKKKSCSFNYFDAMANARITKNMYIVSDPVKVTLVNDEYILESDFQIRFIDMSVEEI